MSETTIPLTLDEQFALKNAAYGAVELVALANTGLLGYAATKASTVGALVLCGAIGPIGHIMSNNKIKVKLNAKNAAEMGDQVLPALTNAIGTLKTKAPDEVDEFRKLVLNAAEEAAGCTQKGEISPTKADMINKIRAALDAT